MASFQATHRFYLAAVEKIDFSPRLCDKIWECPGNEARDCCLMQEGGQVTTASRSISMGVPLHSCCPSCNHNHHVSVMSLYLKYMHSILGVYLVLQNHQICNNSTGPTVRCTITNGPLALLYKLALLFHTNLHVQV